MKTIMKFGMTLALVATVALAQAQSGHMAKKAAVTEAKAQVAADKADMKMNKAARKADKMSGDKEGLKDDRKAMVKKEGKLMKDPTGRWPFYSRRGPVWFVPAAG